MRNYRPGGNPSFKNDNRGGFSNRESAESKFGSLSYDSSWINVGATEMLVKYAEEMGKFMAKNGLTNSKIRSIYGEIKRIQMGDFEKEKSSFCCCLSCISLFIVLICVSSFCFSVFTRDNSCTAV